jgi:hypothetical protein
MERLRYLALTVGLLAALGPAVTLWLVGLPFVLASPLAWPQFDIAWFLSYLMCGPAIGAVVFAVARFHTGMTARARRIALALCCTGFLGLLLLAAQLGQHQLLLVGAPAAICGTLFVWFVGNRGVVPARPNST